MAITRSLVAIVVGIGIGGIAIGRIGVTVVDRAIVGWIAVIMPWILHFCELPKK